MNKAKCTNITNKLYGKVISTSVSVAVSVSCLPACVVDCVARRRSASYDVARLLLMAPINPWQNFTADFGAVAFCTMNIEDFRSSLTSISSTTSSTYSSQKRSLRWTSSKRKTMEFIEIDQLEDTNTKS